MTKFAMVQSGLAPLVSGAKPPKPTTPAFKPKVTVSGAGDRMRRETASALEQALAQGKHAALEHFGLKTAAVPTVRMVAPNTGVRTPAFATTPAPATPMGATSLPGLPSRAGQAASRFMRPVKKTLGLAALGAGGALALGLHHQNQQDRDQGSLVYSPMQGAY